MRSTIPALFVAAGLLAHSAAHAAEYPIDIKTDIKGQYFVVEKSGTANNPVVLTKQVRPNKTSYFIKRWFDCKNWTMKFLGEGESLEEVKQSPPDQDTTAIAQGSIPDQLARHVCPPPHFNFGHPQ